MMRLSMMFRSILGLLLFEPPSYHVMAFSFPRPVIRVQRPVHNDICIYYGNSCYSRPAAVASSEIITSTILFSQAVRAGAGRGRGPGSTGSTGGGRGRGTGRGPTGRGRGRGGGKRPQAGRGEAGRGSGSDVGQRKRREINSYGHYYTQIGELGPIDASLCKLKEDDIHNLIRERMDSKHSGDYQQADKILDELLQHNVHVDDTLAEWKVEEKIVKAKVKGPDSGGAGQGRGSEKRREINSYGHTHTRVGELGPIDSSICKLEEDDIHNLIRERVNFKKKRDFQQADKILDELLQHNVHVDDKLGEWKVEEKILKVKGPDSSGAGRGKGRGSEKRREINSYGHTHTRVGELGPIDSSICKLKEEDIHNLIRERMNLKKKRDFQQADKILDDLRQHNVHVDDKLGEWKVDGNIMRARGRGPDLRNCQTVEEASQMAYGNLDAMTPQSMAAFWTITSRLIHNFRGRSHTERKPNNDELLLAKQLLTVFCHTMERIDSFQQRELAQTAIAFAKITTNVNVQSNDGEACHDILGGIFVNQQKSIFHSVANAAYPSLARSNVRSLSNLAYACALVQVSPKFDDGSTLLDHIAEKSIPFLRLGGGTSSFNSQNLSNMVWAYAKMSVKHSSLYESVADAIIAGDDLTAFHPQALSTIVWSYALVDISHPLLFEKVADAIIASDNFDRFYPQNFSSILWAYATAGVAHHLLFEKIAEEIIPSKSLQRFKPRDLSIMLWAIAKSGTTVPRFYMIVAEEILSSGNLDRFKPQEISNIVWAFATADEVNVNPLLFEKIAQHIVVREDLGSFSPQTISNIFWAYVKAGVAPHPPLFEIMANAAIEKREQFNSEEIANLLWAQAYAGQIDPQFFSSMAAVTKSVIATCNAQALGSIAWAYAVSNVEASAIFHDEFIIRCQEKNNEFTTAQKSQLHQWHIWQEELTLNAGLPAELAGDCYDAFILQDIHPSTTQDDVIAELSSIGVRPEKGFLTRRGYRLDALVEVNGKRIGIEVDGPSHFLGRTPNGSTILKRRQVSHLEGIPVVSVPYWEWGEHGEDRVKKQQYLRSLLGLD